jgi:cytochrome c
MRRAFLLGLAAVAHAVLAGCDSQDGRLPPTVLGGDAERGRMAIERHGCGACHVIAGVRTARGIVGPSLTGLARRPYIAGMLLNETDNLVTWIQDPPAVSPGTVMPRLGVTDAEARDIAAFLYGARRLRPSPAVSPPGRATRGPG